MLDRMAQIIRENPTATVREIAAQLGFSEEKSVYYWLQKERFRGLKEFKRAVLTGRYPRSPYVLGSTTSRAREAEDAYEAFRPPIAVGFSPDGTPILGEKRSAVRLAAGVRSFVLVVDGNAYAPSFCRGTRSSSIQIHVREMGTRPSC